MSVYITVTAATTMRHLMLVGFDESHSRRRQIMRPSGGMSEAAPLLLEDLGRQLGLGL